MAAQFQQQSKRGERVQKENPKSSNFNLWNPIKTANKFFFPSNGFSIDNKLRWTVARAAENEREVEQKRQTFFQDEKSF